MTKPDFTITPEVRQKVERALMALESGTDCEFTVVRTGRGYLVKRTAKEFARFDGESTE